jgi:hypothetical protein
MAYVPLMAILGERADIQMLLRWAVLPLYFLCLWCVFQLTERLYSRRYAPWVCLVAAALPRFFFTSTEFRPDDLWTFFWLLGLLVAVTGTFTVRRAFAFGFIVGLAFAVSVKTAALVGAILVATLFATVLAWIRGERMAFGGIAWPLGAIGFGIVIPPAAMVLYFYSKGAFWIMYYCVVAHNAVLGVKRWSNFSIFKWSFPISLVVLGFCAWLIFRQTPDTRSAVRRTIILLAPWFYAALLINYCPVINREDYLPYSALAPLLAIPLFIWLRPHLNFPGRFFSWVLPAVCMAEVICISTTLILRKGHTNSMERKIHDVLLLTGPKDYVMDFKGDAIYRMRSCYWVFEIVTNHRIRFGLLKVNVPQALEETETKLCYTNSTRFLPDGTRFIASNYLPFDPTINGLVVAGKELTSPSGNCNYSFDVAIPATYAVVSESGITAGQLDGAPYAGPVRLAAGHHSFRRTSGSGRAAIFLDRALAEGFHPLFDGAEKPVEMRRDGT